jgi:hypothetical protein
MVFLVDAQGEKVMRGLLDLALKGGGMQNLPLVMAVKQSLKVLPEKGPGQTTSPDDPPTPESPYRVAKRL